MSLHFNAYDQLLNEIAPFGATVVAVSKTKPHSDIQEMYNHGQLDFGENYVNELVSKHEQLPINIQWHFIGHLQSNKVKYIAPFVSLIHGIDSKKLLKEVSKQAVKCGRIIDVLLQIHIATEETKFGLSEDECADLFTEIQSNQFPGVNVRGMMGMASFSEDKNMVRDEFRKLNEIFTNLKNKSTNNFDILSMGMSNDYKIALEEGSTMIRIGSLIFGARS